MSDRDVGAVLMSYTAFMFRLSTRCAILLVLPAAACEAGGDQTGEADTVVTDSAGISIVENEVSVDELPEWTISSTPLLDIGVVAGAPEYQFFRVMDGVRLPNGGIAVANAGTQQIRFYDADGRFVRSQGGSGEGPGEYGFPYRLLRLPADSLLVYDIALARFSVLSPEGEFVRSFTPSRAMINEPQFAGLIGDSIAVTHETIYDIPAAGFEPMQARVAFIALDGTGTDFLMLADRRMGRIGEGGGRGFVGSPHFEPWLRIAAAPYGLWAGLGRRPEVRLYGAQGNLRRIVRWEAELEAVTEEDVERRIEASVAGADEAFAAAQRRWYADVPANEFFPVYDALVVDRTGALWVHLFQPEYMAGPSTWIVFDAGGRLVARVVLPPESTIMEIGSDYILASQTDDVDVEHVRTWALERGAAEQ